MTKWTIPQDVALPPRVPEAHTIYAQQARIAELEADSLGWKTVAESNQAMCQSWQARAERAEAALREIITDATSREHAIGIAREGLE